MTTRTRSCFLLLAVGLIVAAAATASIAAGPRVSSTPAGTGIPVAPAAEVHGHPGMLALNFRGVGTRDPLDPSRSSYSTDLYSLVSGERIGTGSHELAVAMTAETRIVEHLMTFRLPEGEIVSHDLESVVPDPLHPGHVHVGVHPGDATILPERGTGAYAGRSGKLRMSGWHDFRAFPKNLTFDDFYVIELDPR